MFRSCLPALVVLSLLAASPHAAAQSSSSRASAKSSPATTAIVNINTASASELDALPGIGPKVAARIVEYRQKNGPFKKIEELMNVQGIGEKNFLKLKPQIAVSGKPDGQASIK
jgi:competence protein ComEA